MDPVTFEKFQAIKRYNKTRYRQTLLQYLVTALVLGVCISKALSSFSSSLFSSIKLFFSFSLPGIGGVFVSPKCLFVVCNAIVLFLIRESTLTGPSSPSSENIYEDYVQHRRRSLGSQPPSAVYHAKENKEKSFVVCMGKRADDEMIGQTREREGGRVAQGEKQREVEKEDGGEDEKEEGGEEKVNEREVNELNRRIEDFFARVNRQRKLEAEMPD